METVEQDASDKANGNNNEEPKMDTLNIPSGNEHEDEFSEEDEGK